LGFGKHKNRCGKPREKKNIKVRKKSWKELEVGGKTQGETDHDNGGRIENKISRGKTQKPVPRVEGTKRGLGTGLKGQKTKMRQGTKERVPPQHKKNT